MIKERGKKPPNCSQAKWAVRLLIPGVRSEHLHCQAQSHQMVFVRGASSAKLLNWSYWVGELDCWMGLNWVGIGNLNLDCHDRL